MENLMPAPASGAVHWVRKPGYIKGGLREPVCGIGDKLNSFTSVNEPQYQFRVTCEHCLFWLWDQEQPARKMDIDQRVVNMRFDNRGMSAHDTELAIQRGTEEAIARGIREGLAKVASDFRATKPELQRLVEDGVERALQRGTVRTNLVGIAKIADDEIDAEWDKQNPDFEAEAEEKRRAEIRAEVHNALDERAVPNNKMQIQEAIFELFEQEGFKRRLRATAKDGAAQALRDQSGGAGKVEFTQNVYSPDALSASDIYRQGRNLSEALATSRHHLAGPGVGTQVINVNAEVDSESFKEMVKDAAREYDEESLETYNEEETALMQKAVTSVVVSDQFQDLVKKLVKVALDERDQEAHQRALAWQIAWSDSYLGLTPNASKIGVELQDVGDAVEDFVHLRKLYTTKLWCGATEGQHTVWRKDVTCPDCKNAANI